MKKKYSITIQTIIVFLIFILLVLGLIYFFQTEFLADFYKNQKIKTLKDTAEYIEERIQKQDYSEDTLDYLAISNEVCLKVISNDEKINEINRNNVCILRRLDYNTINNIAKEALDEGGAKLFMTIPLGGPNNFEMINPNEEMNTTYIYALMSSYNNIPVLILVSSMVTPISATIKTIRSQFIIIALVVIMATMLLAFIASKIIIHPIKEIIKSAKDLPNGKYDSNIIKTNSLEVEELNKTLAKANNEILKADKAKKELLGNISHDLRTPLTMIVGYGEMMRDLPKENNKENINIIIEEAKRLSSLVDDLIDVSKMQDGAIKLVKTKVSLNKLLENVYHQYALYCKEKDVHFTLELIEDKIVEIDEARIKQVLYNFINNALNYNEKDNKEIILGVEKIKDKYRIYVYDNGLGISEDKLSLIWDRYYKVDKDHLRHHLGSGIGLSLARDLLELHQLNYGVESKEKEYSKFYFDI